MQVNILKTEGLVHSFEVTVPAADIQRQVEGRLARLSATVKIPGFRPGKVPPRILQQRYGASVLGEVVEQVANDAATKAVTEKKLRPAIEPQIEFSSAPEALPAAKDLVMKLEVETIPEIPDVDFSRISLEKPVTEVGEEEIADSLARVAKGNRKAEPMPEDYAARDGDVAVIDFDGKLVGDGDRLEDKRPGLQGEDVSLELGSKRFIEGFEEQLGGVRAGEKRGVTVTFPAEYHAKDLAGKEAVFDVTVKSVSQLKELPPGDDLAREAGFDNLEALRKAISEQIGQNFGGISRAVARRRLMDALSDRVKFAVPPTLARREFEALWQQVQEAKKHGRLEEEDKKKSDSQLEKDYHKIAERRVRLGLLLNEVARRNKIEVGREDVRRAMFEEARRYPGQEKAVIEYFSKNAAAREQLAAPVLEEKVVDFILSRAAVKEKKVSRDALQKAADE